jgi:hypothetical protein
VYHPKIHLIRACVLRLNLADTPSCRVCTSRLLSSSTTRRRADAATPFLDRQGKAELHQTLFNINTLTRTAETFHSNFGETRLDQLLGSVRALGGLQTLGGRPSYLIHTNTFELGSDEGACAVPVVVMKMNCSMVGATMFSEEATHLDDTHWVYPH